MSASDDRTLARLLESGLATQTQIDDALAVRATMVEMGLHARSVAEILFEKGLIEDEDFEELRRAERRFQGKEQIAGYRLLERLGEGAMGTVYKARQLSLDRDVAIKVLSAELGKDAIYVDRFMIEARAVARLNHTNIISGIDVGEADGIRYLVMEFADGMTVASLLRRGGPLDEERCLLIGMQMTRALDHAHRSDLVHRDVKPDNIIITRDGIAKLCDLGLAKIEVGAGENATRMGTPAYMSPELARGDGNVDERTDLYSLGATLFHMLTGTPPFEGSDASAVMARHLTEPVPDASRRAPDVTPETAAIVSQLMAKHPADRVADARSLGALLEERVRALQIARGATAAASATVVSRPAAPAASPAAPAASPAAPSGSAGASGDAAPLVRRRRRRR